MAHIADMAVITCMDFRFQKYINNWLDKNYLGKTFDRISVAGSSKNLDFVMTQIDVSVRLHLIKEIIVIHHEECGAYGLESTLEKHTEDLHKTKNAVLQKYPDLRISLYYLHLDGSFVLIV